MSATEDTILVASARAAELGITRAVVASTTGAVIEAAAGKFPSVVWVTQHANAKPGEPGLTQETKARFLEKGVIIVTGSHALSGAERSLSARFQGYGPVEIMAQALRMFGAGVKVCVEVATMAMDAGAVPPGEKIVAIGGTGRGADSAIIITPANASRILETKIHEIICKPFL